MKKKCTGRGGYRPGAGAKAADGAICSMLISAAVDQESFDLIEELGGGNLSMGVRKVCHELLRYRNSGTARAPTIKVTEKTAPAPKTKIKLFGKYVDV